MTWHLDEHQVTAYADGSLSGARAASLEAHVVSCAECRGALSSVAPVARLGLIWEEIEERVDRPRTTPVESLLRRFGVNHEDARLLAAAPSLQLSWLLSLAAVLIFAASAAQNTERGSLLYLVLAPLVPVVTVAGAYGRGVDPTFELTRSTPYPTYRLLILRVAAVMVVSLVLVGALGLTLPDAWLAAAWLLPCLALVGVVLVLNRWLDLVVAAGLVAAAYLLTITYSLTAGSVTEDIFRAPVQLFSAVVALGCAVLVATSLQNRESFRRMQ